VPMRTQVFALAFASSLGAQGAWTYLPVIDKTFQEKASSRSSLSMIPIGSQDLGPQDGGTPIRTAVQVMNVGSSPIRVISPIRGGISRIRIQFPTTGDLELAPGDVVKIPIEYDARLDKGLTSFEIAFHTNDPEAPTLRQSFQSVVCPALEANPYRSCIRGLLRDRGSSKAVPVAFISDGSAPFQGVSIEDESAPLHVSGTVTSTGDYVGTLVLDWARIQSGKSSLSGETRVFGTTTKGGTAYAWIQWYVQ